MKNSVKLLQRFLRSKKALAVPVTYLILFVSLVAVISVTYSYAVARIGAKGAQVKTSVAQQYMQTLDDTVRSVSWSHGASRLVYFDDCGGAFKMEPAARTLVLNFTDEQSFYEVIFDDNIGRALYELEGSENSNDGLHIRGDNRAIINQSAFTLTQLYFEAGSDAQQIVLSYRPAVTVVVAGTSNNKPLNIIRISVLTLNSSQTLALGDSFYLRATASTVTTITNLYEFNSSISTLALKASLDSNQQTVWLPISSNANGAVVQVDLVISSVKIQEAET